MLASELVQEIQKAIEENGDHRVTVWGYYFRDVGGVYFDYSPVCVDQVLTHEPIICIDVK